ncbi:hypothetical protein FWC31_00530 [Candidatus Saccharibacteria bacterium]|nr:hypothetical protein [Candidatus Saccharibacteria bacterium]
MSASEKMSPWGSQKKDDPETWTVVESDFSTQFAADLVHYYVDTLKDNGVLDWCGHSLQDSAEYIIKEGAFDSWRDDVAEMVSTLKKEGLNMEGISRLMYDPEFFDMYVSKLNESFFQKKMDIAEATKRLDVDDFEIFDYLGYKLGYK